MGRLYRIIVALFLSIPVAAWAQTTSMDCEQTIALATEEFNSGHFYSVPGILKDCLNSFSREQKQRAYLLLTQTYLLLDDPIGAETSFLEILSANPEFVADEQLHAIDIVYLSKRFTATPRISWFVGAGTNVSPVRVILDLDIARDGNEKYTFLPGYNFGVGGEYSYDDHLRLRLEVNYLHTAYKATADARFHKDVKIFRDRQSWLNLPVYLSYSDNSGAYRPYLFAGYSVSKLFGDNASITLEKVSPSADASQGQEPSAKIDTDTYTKESPNFDFKHRRNEFNHSLIFGGGLKYKIGLDFVFAELRYSAGLRNIVNPDHLYGNHALDKTSGEWVLSSSPASEYGHVDDFIRLDNIAFTVGFIRPLYQPRELKRARTKGVLRKVKKLK